jgi:ABC-2 type transport system ATP-binding protein
MSATVAASGPPPAIVVRDLERRFGSFRAVRDVSFTVARGSLCGFIGHNGAGKTTTLRMIAADLRPTEGSVEVMGHDVAREPSAVRRRLGFMPDAAGIYEELSLEEYLDFFAAIHGIRHAERRQAVDAAMELAGTATLARRRLVGLSRGECQRVLLARTLLHDPDVLVLDEPAAGLDPEGRIELRELLSLLHERGKTILVSSHVLSDLEVTCTDLVLVRRGRVVFEGSCEELLARSSDRCRIRIETQDDGPRLAAAIAARSDVAVLGEEARALDVEAPADLRFARELLRDLIAGGVRVTSFARRGPTLEEAYIEIMAGDDLP